MSLTLVLAALLAGFGHVLSGPDHLAAIAPYALLGKARAWSTGVRWGIGHSTGVFGVGILALLVRHALPLQMISSWAERSVGAILICIGGWALYKALALRPGALPAHHPHGREAFAVGTVHGLAGSSHLLGVLPALALPTDFAAAAYLVLFGAGTVVAMGFFSTLVGWISSRRRLSAAGTQATLLIICAACAITAGAFWLFSNFGA